MALNPLGYLGPFIINKEKRMMTPAEVQEALQVGMIITVIGIFATFFGVWYYDHKKKKGYYGRRK